MIGLDNRCLDCVHHGKCVSEDHAARNGKIVLGCSRRAMKPKPMTHCDEIRRMSVEEMADRFTDFNGFVCPVNSESCLENNCRDCFIEWLKSEVK